MTQSGLSPACSATSTPSGGMRERRVLSRKSPATLSCMKRACQRQTYVIRVKAPGGTKLMPHRHPEDRIYTVMSGVFYIGIGDQFDGDKMHAFPPGSVIVLPGNTSHFH